MHSALVNGIVCDYNFKPHPASRGLYFFYVGDMYVGQVCSFPTGWKAISTVHEFEYGVVGGI